MAQRVVDTASAVDPGAVVRKSSTLVLVNKTRRSRPCEHRGGLHANRSLENPRELALEHDTRALHVPPVGDEMDMVQVIEPASNDLGGDGLGVRERAVTRVEGRDDRQHSRAPSANLEAADFLATERIASDEKRKVTLASELNCVIDPAGGSLFPFVVGTTEHNDSGSGHVSSRVGEVRQEKKFLTGKAGLRNFFSCRT